MKGTLIIAHRGYSSVAPENTKLAFDAAVLFGFDGVEIDVHMTKDNELVILHDETIDRTSDGKGKVEDMTLSELRKYDFGAKFANGFILEKQTIMTFEEFIIAYGTKFKQLNIEIKTNIIHYEGIEKAMHKVIERHEITAELLYSSFNFKSLELMREINKDCSLGFLFEDAKLLENVFDKCKEICDYIHPWFTTLKEHQKLYEDIGLPMNIWTLDFDHDDDPWSKGSMKELNYMLGLKNMVSLISNVSHDINEGIKNG